MNKSAFLLLVTLGCFLHTYGQETVPNPNPQATPDTAQIAMETIRREQQSNRKFEFLRNGGVSTIDRGELRRIFLQNIQPIYRKPNKTELRTLAPNTDDLRQYAEFLKRSKTGIIRLAADFGCDVNTAVLVATPDCLSFTMPGAGSSYSFRTNNYRIRRLADLTFTNSVFTTPGVMLHGILVNLGDVSLEQIGLDSKGAKFLIDFIPVSEYEKASEMERQLIAGIENGGFSYRNSVAAELNKTYLLRSIAYRGKSFRAVENVVYNELGFDKREDVIVAFRVIRRDTDGSITILWKELQSKKSPELKFEKENRNNVRENKLMAKQK